MTWEIADIERARSRADRASPPRLSFARRFFPGLLAAAASAGVIVGDGWQSGTGWTPFIDVGAAFLTSRFGSTMPTTVYAIVGVIVHAFWFVLWGVCFTAVARSLRGGKLFFAGIVATAVLWLLTRVMFPLALGAAELPLMSSAHAMLYLVTVAIALSVGTRLARYA